MKTNKKNGVLLVGTNVRNVAKSARNAGYSVYSLTKYVDEDLKLYSSVEEINGDRDWVKKRTEELSEENNLDVVLCAGYEDLDIKANVLGSYSEESAKVKDKLIFYRILEKSGSGIPFPELNPESPEIILKPRRGGGGERVFFNSNDEQLDLSKELIEGVWKKEYICQRFIRGTLCSVSLIAGKETVPVATNFILAGWKDFNASKFRYCGNITPFLPKKDIIDSLIQTAKDTVEIFNLKGSIGVDLVLADKPYVLEINPRFQGSLDSIELSSGNNLFNLHVRGVEGKRINVYKPKRIAGRAILFSPHTIQIKSNFIGNPYFADIPKKGYYRSEEPLISIMNSGDSYESVKKSLVYWRDVFYNYNSIKKL